MEDEKDVKEGRLVAPFTRDQVDALNRWQESDYVHPFTCPGTDETCPDRALVAGTDGWSCRCGAYVQEWAHACMLREPPTQMDLLASMSPGDAGQ